MEHLENLNSFIFVQGKKSIFMCLGGEKKKENLKLINSVSFFTPREVTSPLSYSVPS